MKKNYGPRIIKAELAKTGASEIVMNHRDIVKIEQDKPKTIRACFDMKYYYSDLTQIDDIETINVVEVRNNIIEKIINIFAPS